MRLVALGVAAVAAGSALSPVRFPARPGWQVGAGKPHACPGVSRARCTSVESWAATVRWRDCVSCMPHRTLAALPRDGIAIQAFLARERPVAARGRLAWPPRLRARDVHAGFEGLPPRIGVYQRFARVGRYEIYLWVFFGRPQPTGAQLARANDELRHARLP